jgi:hypothetical protein
MYEAFMPVITETELLQRIDAFLERHQMAPTTFGRKATGEPQLISSIRNGRSPSLNVVNRVIAFMDEQDAELKRNPPPLELTPPPAEEVELDLPFRQAPATGASSPTCSSTTEQPAPPAASDTCRCSTTANPSSSDAKAKAA